MPIGLVLEQTERMGIANQRTRRDVVDAILVSHILNVEMAREHHLDVIKSADWIIDLGPEGGEKGGQIVAIGTPEEVERNRRSYTGRALSKFFSKGARA